MRWRWGSPTTTPRMVLHDQCADKRAAGVQGTRWIWAPDYHDIVHQPADLGTIRMRLARGATQARYFSTIVLLSSCYDNTAILMRWLLASRAVPKRMSIPGEWHPGFWEPQENAGGEPHAGQLPTAQPWGAHTLPSVLLSSRCLWVAGWQKGCHRRGGRHRGTVSPRMCWTRWAACGPTAGCTTLQGSPSCAPTLSAGFWGRSDCACSGCHCTTRWCDARCRSSPVNVD